MFPSQKSKSGNFGSYMHHPQQRPDRLHQQNSRWGPSWLCWCHAASSAKFSGWNVITVKSDVVRNTCCCLRRLICNKMWTSQGVRQKYVILSSSTKSVAIGNQSAALPFIQHAEKIYSKEKKCFLTSKTAFWSKTLNVAVGCGRARYWFPGVRQTWQLGC